MAEIRAVTPSGKNYRMTRGVDGWKVTDPNEIVSIERRIQSELANDPIANQLFKEGNQSAVWDMLFDKIASEIGGIYTVY